MVILFTRTKIFVIFTKCQALWGVTLFYLPNQPIINGYYSHLFRLRVLRFTEVKATHPWSFQKVGKAGYKLGTLVTETVLSTTTLFTSFLI